jgi:hypothetical protein
METATAVTTEPGLTLKGAPTERIHGPLFGASIVPIR